MNFSEDDLDLLRSLDFPDVLIPLGCCVLRCLVRFSNGSALSRIIFLNIFLDNSLNVSDLLDCCKSWREFRRYVNLLNEFILSGMNSRICIE